MPSAHFGLAWPLYLSQKEERDMSQQPSNPEDSFAFTALILLAWTIPYAALELSRANWLAGLVLLSIAVFAGGYLVSKRSEWGSLWVLLKRWRRYLWVGWV